MDFQNIIDAMNNSMRGTRSDYHLTLGGLIEELKKLKASMPVYFSSANETELTNIGNEDSYRGYYCDLAFDKGEKVKTVGELLKQCQKALGKEYTGYRGGEFLMDADTPLWKAEYGTTCGSEAIMGSHVIDGKLILICKQIED